MAKWRNWRAGTLPSPDDADTLQRLLTDLAILAIADTARFWRTYGQHPKIAVLLPAALPELVSPYTQAAAMVTANWYDGLAPNLPFTAQPFGEIATERIAATANWSLAAPVDPLDRLAGSVKRMTFDASRQTVVENATEEMGDIDHLDDFDEPESYPSGTRWVRYASSTACGFCRMLATRGAVYRSESSAVSITGRSVNLTVSDRRRLRQGRGFTPMSKIDKAEIDEALERRSRYTSWREARKVGKFAGDEKVSALRGARQRGAKYHDNCKCIAVPVRPGTSYEPPDYVEKWEQDYIDAVRASKKAGETIGPYRAIDPKAVTRRMDAGRVHAKPKPGK